jgi:hypothetical protein
MKIFVGWWLNGDKTICWNMKNTKIGVVDGGLFCSWKGMNYFVCLLIGCRGVKLGRLIMYGNYDGGLFSCA